MQSILDDYIVNRYKWCILMEQPTGDIYPNRRGFIGGSDARIIMGDDESRPHPPLARETGPNRAGGPVRQPHCSARSGDRTTQPALVRAQHRANRRMRPASAPASGAALDGGNP